MAAEDPDAATPGTGTFIPRTPLPTRRRIFPAWDSVSTRTPSPSPAFSDAIRSRKVIPSTPRTSKRKEVSQGSTSKVKSEEQATTEVPEPIKSGPKIPPNLYLVGAKCSGKTTLLNALQEHFADESHRKFGNITKPPPSTVDEVVRKVMKEQSFTVKDLENDPIRGKELQRQILLGQYAAEKPLVDADTWYFSDRSGIDALVYTKAYVSEAASKELAETPEWTALKQNMQFSNAIVVYCEAGNAEWLRSDDVRMAYGSTAAWEALNWKYRLMLKMNDVQYITMPKGVRDLGERVQMVARALGMSMEAREKILAFHS